MSWNAVFGLMIIACWLVFCLYWLVSARSAKPSTRSTGDYINWGFRAVVVVVVIVRLHFGGTWHPFAGRVTNPVLGAAGAALCVLGIALAIWARVYLGRNWGSPMTIKKNPELVTTGPYAYVRHPIYSGVLLAVLGSVLATSLLRLAVVIPFLGAYFIYSAVREQKNMLKEFPGAYPAYMKRTKMLIPFVL